MEIQINVGFTKDTLKAVNDLTQALAGFEVRTSGVLDTEAATELVAKKDKGVSKETKKLLKENAKKMKVINDEIDEEEIENDEIEDDELEDETEEEEIGYNAKSVLEAARSYAKRNSRDQLAKVLKGFNVKAVSELKEKDYPKFMSKVQ